MLELQQLTLEIAENINQLTFEQLLGFVEVREELILKFQQSNVRDEEQLSNKELIEQIVSYDALIIKRMTSLKNEASRELVKFNNSKLQRNSYDSSYSQDSHFFDYKK